MTNYEYLINRSEECLERAKNINDVDVKKFFLNASKGFKIKAGKLTLEQAGKEFEGENIEKYRPSQPR